jgi:hypothetical protein
VVQTAGKITAGLCQHRHFCLRSAQGPCGSQVKVMVWPTVSRPVCLSVRHLCGFPGQILVTVRELRICWHRVPTVRAGPVCTLQLLLVLACAVILESESHGTHAHIYGIRFEPPRHGGPHVLQEMNGAMLLPRHRFRVKVISSRRLTTMMTHKTTTWSELIFL